MKLYAVNMALVATAYIKAKTPQQALELADSMTGSGIELSGRYQPAGDNICIDGRDYSALLVNAEDIALSPAITVDGLADDVVEFVEELE